MFTKKHYEIITKALREHTLATNFNTIRKSSLIRELKKIFSEDNPDFDSDEFEEACYG